jgi:predicted alpha/beta-hydrolase family hydrolase
MLELDTPRGPARAHLHEPEGAPPGAVVLGHGAATRRPSASSLGRGGHAWTKASCRRRSGGSVGHRRAEKPAHEPAPTGPLVSGFRSVYYVELSGVEKLVAA